MTNRTSFAAVACLGILAAACGGVQTQARQDHSLYDFSTFMRYHGGRDTKVVVVPPPGAGQGFAEAVTTAMYGAHIGQPTRFTTTPGPTAEENLRVVMAFNVQPRYHLCEARDLKPRQRVDFTYLQAAWCWDDTTLSYVQGRVPVSVASGDPAFRSLIAGATRDLFPRTIDDRDRNRNRNGIIIGVN